MHSSICSETGGRTARMRRRFNPIQWLVIGSIVFYAVLLKVIF